MCLFTELLLRARDELGGWVIVSRASLDLYTVRKNEHSIVDSLYLYIMPTDTFENP